MGLRPSSIGEPLDSTSLEGEGLSAMSPLDSTSLEGEGLSKARRSNISIFVLVVC